MKTENNIESKFLRAHELVELGETWSAKHLLEEIVMEEPAYARAHYLLGWIYFDRLANYKKAEMHFKLCKKYDSLFPHNYMVYAELLAIQNKMEELMVLVSDAVTIPGIDKAFMYHKMAYAQEGRGHYSEALSYIRKSKKHSLSGEWLTFIRKERSRINRKIGLFRHIAAFL
jgi:tetratricopeptide (TPR) repeat protein